MLILAHVERGELVEELAARSHQRQREGSQGRARQMVDMPEPPLELMVSAAASPSRQVAQRAQTSISELLRKWQGQLTGETSSSPRRPSARTIGRSPRCRPRVVLDARLRLAGKNDGVDRPSRQHAADAELRPAGLALRIALGSDKLSRSQFARQRGSSRLDGRRSAPDSVFNPPSRMALQSILPDDEQVG